MIERLHDALGAWNPEAEAGERSRRAVQLLVTAEELLAAEAGGASETETWHAWLETTGVPAFLLALEDDAMRLRWSEASFAAIRRSRYTLEDMLANRVRTRGKQTYLEELRADTPMSWSYERVQRRARGFAAALLAEHGEETRVALFLTNSVDGACCDLACLLYDILVTPLNIHFGTDELIWILDRLRITAVVSDSEERLRRMQEIRRRTAIPFTIFSITPSRAVDRGEARLLQESVSRLTPEKVDDLLLRRRRFALEEPCTVMFTSGSTGRPKGVVFTQLNLVSKRFARAAALPTVGEDEKLLCYLPLYHTFGRYLELLGMLYWRGTYVFAGNPSTETLLAGLRQVHPTGLIGVPQRWSQLAESCLAVIEGGTTEPERAFREVVGPRLRWGLSAAGYLNPRVFRFFQRYGVELCSGFGMTEATGGITMNPPGDYRDNTVGVPLPGMRIRFSEEGEMQIGGVYVASYLAEEGEGLELQPCLEDEEGRWIETGDLFEPLGDGHITLVDRIKDIYKNSRGQTIAPRRVEKLFFGVAGVKRTFLVGDHRAFNVLLIVPDMEDPLLQAALDEESRYEYFHRIVTTANQELAPFERVVNFYVLDRDFELEREELTPKGSYRRKQIEENFAEIIDSLYESPLVELEVGDLCVELPRWFFRDLGILETDIEAGPDRLLDTQRERDLLLCKSPDGTRLRVGDLEYSIEGNQLDLGLFVRQPRLWMGNPSLIAFGPCKAGWDVDLGPVSPHVLVPREPVPPHPALPLHPREIDDSHLLNVNVLLQQTLFGSREEAHLALGDLCSELGESDYRLDEVIRSRITALATHPDERLRCEAYKVLLLADLPHDDSVPFAAFINSGLTFINEESIESIASTSFESRRLEALRKRMYQYRRRFSWPISEVARSQFKAVLRLLVRFVRQDQGVFKPVRAELAAWILHTSDPELSAYARELLEELVAWVKENPQERVGVRPRRHLKLEREVQFDDDIPPKVRRELLELFFETSFLQQSIRLAFEEQNFELEDIERDGIWVARLRGGGISRLFRVSVNTRGGRHFDLQVILRKDKDPEAVQETIHWMMVIAGYPFERRVMPRFGCMWAEHSAMSLEYIDNLTVGEKIREFANMVRTRVSPREAVRWRKLYIRAMATFFRAWRNSGGRIVPSAITPRNVVVPERDFHEGAVILSLAGWKPYSNTHSLFRPLFRNFFARTWARYPRRTEVLELRWIFDACIEGLGLGDGKEMLDELRNDCVALEDEALDRHFVRALDEYLETFEEHSYIPLPVNNAIDRYHIWRRNNIEATAGARADILEELIGLYHLDRFGETGRYHLYRHTYFDEVDPAAREAFDNLLAAMVRRPDRPASQHIELSDLQAALVSHEDRDTFSRMVFPQAHRPTPFELMTFGQSDQKQVTVLTHMRDRKGERYDLREPVDAEELGQLYRLFYQEQLPMHISAADRHLSVFDPTGRVVGGICYRMQRPDVAHIDGIVVKSTLMRRGIATGMLEDFVSRMAARGVKVVKTTFMMRAFCGKRGFATDRRWGGLVRFIPQAPGDPSRLDVSALSEG